LEVVTFIAQLVALAAVPVVIASICFSSKWYVRICVVWTLIIIVVATFFFLTAEQTAQAANNGLQAMFAIVLPITLIIFALATLIWFLALLRFNKKIDNRRQPSWQSS